MLDLPLPVTPQEARRVWKSQARASARSVAMALNQAGRPVHYTTVARWKRNGWRSVEGVHPLESAMSAVDAALPVLTGDPTMTVKDFVQGAEDRVELEPLTEEQRLSAALREAQFAEYLVYRAFEQQCGTLMETRTKELAVLISAMAALRSAMSIAVDQVLALRERANQPA